MLPGKLHTGWIAAIQANPIIIAQCFPQINYLLIKTITINLSLKYVQGHRRAERNLQKKREGWFNGPLQRHTATHMHMLAHLSRQCEEHKRTKNEEKKAEKENAPLQTQPFDSKVERTRTR